MKTLKTVLIYILLISAICSGQSLEERVKALEDWKPKVDSALGFSVPIEPIDTLLPKPIYEGIVMNSINQDCFIYSSPFIRNGIWTCYVNCGGTILQATSPNGLNSWTLKPTTGSFYGPVIYVNEIFRGSAHKWYNGQVTSYFYGSLNGIDWSATSADWTQNSGEDRCLIWENSLNLYRSYIRVRPIPRTIGYSESRDFYNWSRIVEILKPDAIDGNRIQFYQMSVIHPAAGYFGLLNTYRVGDAGQDVEQSPPYTELEHTSDLQIVFSTNGKDNWLRLNNRKVFIPRQPGVKQQFATWCVIGDYVYIYTICSKRRHTQWDDLYNTAGNYFYSERYKISLTDLYKYLQ